MRKAQLSGRQDLLEKARQAYDPVQAKRILNILRDDHQQEWDSQVEKIALTGLRAKFEQNRHLQDFLCGTKQLILGEASKNTRWGIGMDLSDPLVLDHTKWLQSGNLLGRLLMKVRSDLLSNRKRGKNH